MCPSGSALLQVQAPPHSHSAESAPLDVDTTMSQVQAIGGLLTYLMKGARRNALETGRKAMGSNDGRGRDRARGSFSTSPYVQVVVCVCATSLLQMDF